MKRSAVALCAVLAACDAGAPIDPDTAAVRRGAAWLWSRQASDGGWHSETYGLLRNGDCLTALALVTLLDVPEEHAPRPAGAVDRAASFLARRVDERGCLGDGAPVPEYPNYATALAVVALERIGGYAGLVERMRDYLRGQQFDADLGYATDHPAYGGFGMGGAPRPAPHHGHLDLSMTRYALEALGPHAGACRAPARAFLARCATEDGGFDFSPAVPGAHKARAADGASLAYGTTTADGLLALRALGLPDDDAESLGARDWLRTHHSANAVPGFTEGSPWASGLFYYWAAASCRALAPVDPADAAWRGAFARELRERQQPDGAWRNPSDQVKEDDPLIATSLALQALTALRR